MYIASISVYLFPFHHWRRCSWVKLLASEVWKHILILSPVIAIGLVILITTIMTIKCIVWDQLWTAMKRIIKIWDLFSIAIGQNICMCDGAAQTHLLWSFTLLGRMISHSHMLFYITLFYLLFSCFRQINFFGINEQINSWDSLQKLVISILLHWHVIWTSGLHNQTELHNCDVIAMSFLIKQNPMTAMSLPCHFSSNKTP